MVPPLDAAEPVHSEHVVRTYRYLRVSLVGLAVLLAISITLEIALSGRLLGSISAYYYTPVRAIFVGVLMSTAVCFIAVKGRGVEDLLLNAAGMLAPVVAIVPTPLDDLAREDRVRVPPPDVVAVVDNNLTALLFLAVTGLAFATWTAARRDPAQRVAASRGILVGFVLALATFAWFQVSPGSFRDLAHYVAAVGFFGLLAVVAFLHGRAGGRWCRTYRSISFVMMLAVLAAIVLAILGAGGAHTLFWLETVLLAAFAVFWSLQTAEYWNDGLPAA